MTPQRLKQIAQAPIPRPILLLGSLLPLVALLAGMARFVTTAADNRYVRRDSAAIQHRTDSLVADARAVRSETLLQTLVRDCQRRGGCQ